jgi:hypothetical protein
MIHYRTDAVFRNLPSEIVTAQVTGTVAIFNLRMLMMD